MTELQNKPTKYYIDFENVHGAGLKGVDVLAEGDEVFIIYSQAAETFHIEHAIDILKSKAHIEFVEVDGGTRNAADFQLIVALFGNMDEAFDYAIVSGDTGFDAAIKMGERMGLPNVCRLANIRGDVEVEKAEKSKSRRSRRSRSGRDAASETEQQSQEPQTEEANTAPEPQDQAQPDKQAESSSPAVSDVSAKTVEPQADNQPDQPEGQAVSSKRRTRRRRRGNGLQDGQAAVQTETVQQAEEPVGDIAAPIKDFAAEPAEETIESPAKPADEAPSAEEHANPSRSSAATKKKIASKAREEARQDTVAARARAAEAMKLALAEPTMGARDAVVPETSTAGEPETAPNAEERDVTARIKSLLSEKGVELTDAQIATVASATEAANGRQDFYRRIIKIERQQKGRALYRQVREHYEALKEAL